MFSFSKIALATTAALALSASAAPVQEKRGQYNGQATFFSVGLGACGWTNSDSDFVVAIDSAMYSGGSHCGKQLSITNTKTGQTQSAQAVDECPTCSSNGSLDMSPSLFSALNNGNMDDGEFPISWSFN